MRWYFYTNSSPWIPSRFYGEAVSEVQRKFLGTLFNTYSFYVLYAEIDKFNPTEYKLSDCKLSVMDKWILSAMNTLIKFVDDSLENYKITEAAREIGDFVDKLSNWYVRRCRERYWGSEMTEDKKAAYMTLYTVLEATSRLVAPFVPFIAEEIYRNIVCSVDASAPESVHLTSFPTADENYIDSALERGMAIAEEAAVLGRAARNAASVKNRQPLNEILLCGEHVGELSEDMLAIIRDELNVKRIEYVADAGDYVSYSVKPQLKTLGPKYGAKLGKIRAYLTENPEKVVSGLRGADEYSFTVDGEEIALGKDDVLITVLNKEGYSVQSGGGITVILDVTLTPELIEEGYMREIVSKVQTMRKDSGFEVTDHIALYYDGDAEIEAVIEKYKDEIAGDVLADRVEKKSDLEKRDVNGKQVGLGVVKL